MYIYILIVGANFTIKFILLQVTKIKYFELISKLFKIFVWLVRDFIISMVVYTISEQVDNNVERKFWCMHIHIASIYYKLLKSL